MDPAVELNELMERIRQAASRENGLVGGIGKEISATTDLPPVPEPLPLPPSPVAKAAGAHETTRPETLLDEAASMLTGGRKRTPFPTACPRCCASFFATRAV